ncbi:MAG: hypothetical protein ACOC80_11050 [Petrotogales bacterium]
MDNTILQQGKFTADGSAKYIILRSDIGWIRVYNFTAAEGATNNDGVEFYWQRGMPNGSGLYWYHPANDQTVAVDALADGTGFYYIDTTDTEPSGAVDITGTTDATRPVISTASTSGLSDGDIVRLSSVTDAESLGGWDFQIDTVVAATSFRMYSAMANSPGADGTGGKWRRIPFDPIFYPRYRYIVNITQATNAVITTSVDHGYKEGQKIRINLPDSNFGMTEINGVKGVITAVTANTITTNIDTSGYTAFSFALPANVPFTVPTVVPVGIDTGTAIADGYELLSDATYNDGYIAMKLMPGAAGPAGDGGGPDVMYWVAGKSFSNTIE